MLKFKIGDTVKINTKFPSPKDVGKVCVVIRTREPTFTFEYDVKEKMSYWYCPVNETEIEKLSEKGKQLLFPFMDNAV